MKTNLLSLGMLCLLANFTFAADPITLKLWPDGPPTAMVPKSDATVKLIQSYGGAGPNRITDVSDPTITIFRPEKPNGTSVIVAPGGGFMFLSYAHEGTQVCEWLNSLGVTAVLLKYRTPTRDEKEMFELPVQDAQRALGIVRHHAAEWNLDPKRVGLLGFSAGANLAGHAAWDREVVPAVVEKLAAAPAGLTSPVESFPQTGGRRHEFKVSVIEEESQVSSQTRSVASSQSARRFTGRAFVVAL